MFSGTLNDLKPEQIVALMSSLVFNEKVSDFLMCGFFGGRGLCMRVHACACGRELKEDAVKPILNHNRSWSVCMWEREKGSEVVGVVTARFYDSHFLVRCMVC